jgi:hypothetical protein
MLPSRDVYNTVLDALERMMLFAAVYLSKLRDTVVDAKAPTGSGLPQVVS